MSKYYTDKIFHLSDVTKEKRTKPLFKNRDGFWQIWGNLAFVDPPSSRAYAYTIIRPYPSGIDDLMPGTILHVEFYSQQEPSPLLRYETRGRKYYPFGPAAARSLVSARRSRGDSVLLNRSHHIIKWFTNAQTLNLTNRKNNSCKIKN